MRHLILLGVMVALSGCAGLPALEPTTTTPVCKVLVGPIKYNTYKSASRRFAGPDLAKDLSVRNKIGVSLNCPAYKG